MGSLLGGFTGLAQKLRVPSRRRKEGKKSVTDQGRGAVLWNAVPRECHTTQGNVRRFQVSLVIRNFMTQAEEGA